MDRVEHLPLSTKSAAIFCWKTLWEFTYSIEVPHFQLQLLAENNLKTIKIFSATPYEILKDMADTYSSNLS